MWVKGLFDMKLINRLYHNGYIIDIIKYKGWYILNCGLKTIMTTNKSAGFKQFKKILDEN